VKVAPPTRQRKARPIALVDPGWHALRIQTLDGDEYIHGARACYDALTKLEGHAVYTTAGVMAMRTTTGAKAWEGSCWRGRTTTMALDGTKLKVMSLRGVLDGDPDPFGALELACRWFGQFGVGPGSMSAMGWALWRSTLTQEVELYAPGRITRPALYGGRQAVREPRSYQHMVATDITAAYPHSMAARPYALTLRKVSNATTLDPCLAGIMTGTISVPEDMPFGPVPYRVAPDMISFPRGQIDGTWTWAEAEAAEQLGCHVQVDTCYAPGITGDLFGAWWQLVQEARHLPGAASRFAKGAANSVWGLFGMRGDDRESIRWSDDAGVHPVRIDLDDRNLPHGSTAHVAAETSSRVRVRMLREGCYGIGRSTNASPVHIDTDGIIIRRSAVAGMTTVAVPGEWRIKTAMRKVDIRAPQVYRYQCGQGCGIDHRAWHYSVSGVSAEAAESIFDRVGHAGTTVGFAGLDMVLPAFNISDPVQVARARAAGDGMKGVMQ
jgi:hypothetical protein